jgi:hypothetical protein
MGATDFAVRITKRADAAYRQIVEEEELAARNAAYDRAVATHAKAAKLRRARMLKPHYRPTVEQLENYHIASRWPDLTPAAVGIKEDCLV